MEKEIKNEASYKLKKAQIWEGHRKAMMMHITLRSSVSHMGNLQFVNYSSLVAGFWQSITQMMKEKKLEKRMKINPYDRKMPEVKWVLKHPDLVPHIHLLL